METFVASTPKGSTSIPTGDEDDEFGRIPFCLRPSHKIPDEECKLFVQRSIAAKFILAQGRQSLIIIIKDFQLERFLERRRRCNNEEKENEGDELISVIEYDKTRTIFIIVVTIVIIIYGIIITLLVLLMLTQEKEFNIHHSFMTFSTMILIPSGTVLYRLFPNVRISTLNFYHICVNVLGITLLILGFIRGIISHQKLSPSMDHFTSVHSWIGVSTMFLVGCLLGSGLTFLRFDYCCDFTQPTTWYIRLHKMLGKATIMSLFVSGITGYSGSLFRRSESKDVFIINSIGVLSFILFLLTYNLLFDPKFQRKMRPTWKYIYLSRSGKISTVSSKTIICKGELLKYARNQFHKETNIKEILK